MAGLGARLVAQSSTRSLLSRGVVVRIRSDENLHKRLFHHGPDTLSSQVTLFLWRPICDNWESQNHKEGTP